jgi:multiple sugar transport system permease protein
MAVDDDNLSLQKAAENENEEVKAPEAEAVEQETVEAKDQLSETEAAAEEEKALKNVKLKKSIGHEAMTNRWGYVFVAPFVIVFCTFNLWPTINTFMLAFTNARMDRFTQEFVGFEQFKNLVKDPYFWGALKNTFIIWGMNFIPQLGIALLLAIYLSDTRLNLAGRGFFRAIVYLPNLLTAASVAILFRYLFGEAGYEKAPANQFLRALGLLNVYDPETQELLKVGMLGDTINFFRSVPFTRGLVSFIQWWMWYGHTLILLMAGITSIPESLYESAVVDGANSRQTSFYITLPLLRPMMLYILVTSMIGGMQMFEVPRLITNLQGSPNNSIRTTVLYQYNSAFDFRNLSYGAAVSIGIFFVTIVLALLIFFFMQDRSELKKKKGGVK